MSFKTDIFNVVIKRANDGSFIHFLNINAISPDILKLINAHIVSICDSEADTPIDIVKKELKVFFDSKTEKTKMGAVAEFIVHLYLKELGFKQECLFRNLEENSIKKGFDGYYTFENIEWIMESKSGNITTKNISHKGKINEAYNDLKSKIERGAQNNPWKNALHHAKLVGTGADILRNIKKLSDDYINKTYPDINNLNIIPASTIFHETGWKEENVKAEHDEIIPLLPKFNFKEINIICINKASVSALINCLTPI